MALVYYNLDIIQGSTFSAQLFATNSDGSAIDLTGYETRGIIKYNYGTGVALVSLDPTVNTGQAPPLNTYTASSGVIDVSLSAEETSNLPVTVGVYDIEMYNSDETEVRKLLDGRVKVHPEVTNV